MLSFFYLLSQIELDQIVASYGVAEDISQNNEYLLETIELALEISGAKVCYISLLDSVNQKVISGKGLDTYPIVKNKSLNQFTVNSKSPTIINDIDSSDIIFEYNDTKSTHTYYAGFPLINNEGIVIGTLSVMDNQANLLDEKQIEIMTLVAKGLMKNLDDRKNLIKLIKEINQNFKPAACANLSCLQGELAHLQSEVIESSEELKAQKNELNIVNNNLSKFAHRIAHDLKAPLRSINTFAQLIKRQIDKQDVKYKSEHFEYVNSSILELHRMIDNVLDIAEMKSNVNREKVSISELVEKVELLLSNNIKAHKIQFIKPNVDVLVKGYKSLLLQVFQNIISNAVKYHDPNKDPMIKVSFDMLDDKVLVKISDNGIGISKENLKEIMKPFNRVSSDSEVSGLGIGLDTCNIIINDMGSELKVDSNLGDGTTFSFEIPIN